MKLYVATEWENRTVPVSILENENVHGLTLRIPVVNFLMGNGYNNEFLYRLNKEIEGYRGYDKEIAIGIAFGMYWPVFSDCRYVVVKDSHHGGVGTPVSIRQPVFWDESYYNRVKGLVQWLGQGLLGIDQVKMTGVNEKFEETRISDQNYAEEGYTAAQAWSSAAGIWKGVGYNSDVATEAIKKFMRLWDDNFDCQKVMVVLGTLNGFPCINGSDECQPFGRSDIARRLIDYGRGSIPDFMAESTALTSYGGTPGKVVNNGVSSILQFEKAVTGKVDIPSTNEQIDEVLGAIENGRGHGASIIECFKNNVLGYPGIKV